MTAHKTGKVDGAGVIHDSHADVVPRRPGVRRFLILVGWSLNDREWERLPRWERLYRSNIWAFKEARTRFKYQIPAEQSRKDRAKAYGFAMRSGVKLRTQHFLIYLWCKRGMYTGSPA